MCIKSGRLYIIQVICGLVLVCIVIGLLTPAPVRADVGVQPVLPGGSSISPGEETPIQMADEVVTMNVRSATEADNALVKINPKSYAYDLYPVWYQAVAEVEADFTMKNPTSEAVSMTAWFPLASALEKVDWNFNPSEIVPTIESFQVSVDGNPVDYAVSELPNPKGTDKPPLPWASFPVTFPGKVETVIHVSYVLPLQPAPKQPVVDLYYVFQTGAGWAGPIGRAELIVNLPYPASAATLSGMRSLYLPPGVPKNRVDLPAGAVLGGNQARWMWKNFEPGPEDDFAIWLLKPGKWQELETARAAVKVNPVDGQAWLDLATTYFSLSIDAHMFRLLIFSSYYLPPGIKAYQKAAELLPEHPLPHIGLGLLTLAPYLEGRNAPPVVIQSVQKELQTAKELEAKNPDLIKKGYLSSWDLEDALNSYFYNDATATVEAATQAVYNATYTAQATIEYATRTAGAIMKATAIVCWATAGPECLNTASPTATLTPEPTLTATPTQKPTFTATTTPSPSTTPQPTLTTPPTTVETTGSGQSLVIIVTACVIVLVLVGYLVIKRKLA